MYIYIYIMCIGSDRNTTSYTVLREPFATGGLDTVPYYTILYDTILYYTILYDTVPYHET